MVKKVLKSKLFYLALVVLAIIIAVSIISKKNVDRSNVEVVEETLSATAELGEISESLSYGGTISDNKTSTISLAGSVTVDQWQVKAGDYVEEGQLIATIDKVSAIAAIAELNDLMESLDAAIETSRSDTIASTITAPAAGRIMAVYAESGNSVVDTMYNNSALMLMSLDGRLALDIENTELSRGDSVTVLREDGTQISGTVLQVTEGLATITVSDDSADYQENVTVLDTQGKELGSGQLYIHSQLKVTGYSGTIDYIYVKLGAEVSQGQSLIYLTDTGYSGEYDKLITQRHKLEQQMQDLYAVWQSGGLYAESAGCVTELIAQDSSANSLAYNGSSFVVSLLSEGDPADGSQEEEPKKEGKDEATGTKTLAQVTGIAQQDDGSLVFTLSTGSTINSGDLEGKTGNVNISDIQVGDILVLNYDENAALTSVTVYQSNAQGGDNQNGMEGMGEDGEMSGMSGESGGMTGGTAGTDTTQTTVSYTMEETQLCTFSPYDTANIELTVDELDMSNISLGQSVTVTLDALPGESFDGSVIAIDPEGSNSGGNSKYTVTVSLERTADMLTGMNATVTIDLATKENVLLIPLAAIQEDATGIYVYTKCGKNDEMSSPVFVTTGASDGENVEILDGLSEGDTVYYSYSSGLKYTFNR